MNAIAVLCSRIGSSRLPSKTFKVIAGKPAMDHCLSRLKQVGVPVILAVPPHEAESFRPYAERHGVELGVGHPDSPLHRTAQVLEAHPEADYFLRATHDDILIDSQSAQELMRAVERSGAGYGTSSGLISGAGLECVAVENLKCAVKKYQKDAEYISYFVRGVGLPNPKTIRVPVRQLVARNYRLELDYPEDATVLHAVLTAVGPDASLDDVVRYLDKYPEILRLNKLPDVSFYTCAYNAERFTFEAVASVVDFLDRWGEMHGCKAEYVFVDDGSSDRTLTELAKGLRVHRAKIIVNERNLGLASSANIAVNACRGKWVMRVDADDTINADAVAHLLREAGNADAYYSVFEYIDPQGDTIEASVGDPAAEHHAGGALMRRSLLAELQFKDGVRLGDGAELYERLRQVAKIEYVPYATWNYRRYPESLTAGKRG